MVNDRWYLSTSSVDISINDDISNNENHNSSVAKSIADIIQRVTEPQSELKQQFDWGKKSVKYV